MHFRLSHAAFLFLPATTFGQWWLGADLLSTTNARFRTFEVGIAARGQHKVDPHWMALANIGSTIPTSTKVDRVSGGPRQLASAPALQTRYFGTAFETSQFLSFGMLCLIAPSRKERRRITPYIGLTTGPTTRISIWNVNVTTIASGDTKQSQGTTIAFAWSVSPFAGIRTKAIQGFFLFEAVRVFSRSLEGSSDWRSLCMFNLGYVRRIGRS